MKYLLFIRKIVLFILLAGILNCSESTGTDSKTQQNNLPDISGYPVVGTNQITFYNNSIEISAPSAGDAFYGQDAQYIKNSPKYRDNGDGTVTDLVTGLMWSQSPDLNGDGKINIEDKLTYEEALANADKFNLAGYNDWRLPTIKEQYSLIIFSGKDPSGYEGTATDGLVPFIDTNYFEFGYGDSDAGERIIDAQFATTTKYVSTTMDGNETMFGVNFADGRIKGYPSGTTPIDPKGKGFYVFYVRGNETYGINNLVDNGDSTVTDNATGLMWMQFDSASPMTWEEALSYAENLEFGGYNDWRLPDVKELQSIVDYTRSPETTSSPAIDPLFQCTQITNEAGQTDYPFYWSGTTHANWTAISGGNAAYVSFGRAMGYMFNWVDVHGAGAQRSDPKVGDPADYPTGHGPQGDAIRVFNYVRCVRGIK
ncbi:MAG: DUF1566 domain-containing protein [Calditrichae bacterium]|nr:DUF1566 domain-containing protein [Calditrichia bacterium]